MVTNIEGLGTDNIFEWQVIEVVGDGRVTAENANSTGKLQVSETTDGTVSKISYGGFYNLRRKLRYYFSLCQLYVSVYNTVGYIGIGCLSDPTGSAGNNSAIAFRFGDGAGNNKIYAYSSDGANETATDTGLTFTNATYEYDYGDFAFEWDPVEEEIKYYHNGILVATHTSSDNIPSILTDKQFQDELMYADPETGGVPSDISMIVNKITIYTKMYDIFD
ncbi:MAG: hypothetical protein ABEK36_04440 [Candidatus Aenigmatarchaeota archaeon]